MRAVTICHFAVLTLFAAGWGRLDGRIMLKPSRLRPLYGSHGRSIGPYASCRVIAICRGAYTAISYSVATRGRCRMEIELD